jgi:transcriptional regulator with XRE-family HTH domain
MARAGNALKQVLKTYGISQNRLAIATKIDSSNLSRWVSGDRDPLAEAVYEIYKALKALNPEAAREFVWLYLDAPELEDSEPVDGDRP